MSPVSSNSVLFSFKLSIGKTAIAGCPMYTNEAIATLVPKDGRLLPEYLYYILPHLDYSSYQQPATKGETLNKRSLARVLVPVPSIEEQESIISQMQELDIELQGYQELAQVTVSEARIFIQNQIQRI